jgi:putative lipoprotein
MRPYFFFAVAAGALLAGCNSSNAPAPQAAPVAPIADSVSGSVALREPRELSAQTHLDVRVVDVAQPEIVLGQTSVSPANSPPVAFNLPIDSTKVDAKRTYAIEAMLIDGDRRFLPVLQYPVLTRGAPAHVNITVAPEPTPAEKMYGDYKKVFAQIGGMKAVNGTSLNDTTSVGWDAFVQGGKIRVVREITDLDADKGRITFKMAYQNDKPWVVVKEESPAGSNRPYATTRVGWDDSGQLVLKEKSANGQSSEVAADEARSMYDHAAQALNTAQAKVPKK